MIAGGITSFAVGEWLDGSLIITIILFMAILGYFQDAKAEQSLAQLKKLEVDKTRVIRQGKLHSINSELLVPGDLVLLQAGESISADMRIISSQNAATDESTLTGESLPINKQTSLLP